MNEELKRLTPLVKQSNLIPNSVNINCVDDTYHIYLIDNQGTPHAINPLVNDYYIDDHGEDVVVSLDQINDFFCTKLNEYKILTDSQYLKVVNGNIVYGEDGHEYPITNMPPVTVTPVLTDKADQLITDASYVSFPDIEQVHEIRDEYNVSDYIIFDDCRTRGKVNKILVGIDELPFYYDSKSIVLDNKGIYFDVDKYEYTKEDKNNIDDDAYGTYVDVTITYKYDTSALESVVNKVTKRLQLCGTDRMTYIRQDITDYGKILPFAYEYNYQGSSLQPSDIVEGNEAPITMDGFDMDWQIMKDVEIKPFCLVFNKNRLVAYDLGVDGISEFYISSCIVYKVNKQDESRSTLL